MYDLRYLKKCIKGQIHTYSAVTASHEFDERVPVFKEVDKSERDANG